MSTWRMPAETARQERLWMAFPTGGYTLGDTAEAAHAARSVWAAVANAAVEFEPVTMVVDPSDVGTAAATCPPAVEVLTAELNDAWMRDIGPTFVLDGNGAAGRRGLGLQRLGRPGLGAAGTRTP
jgi:agmatine deiminase